MKNSIVRFRRISINNLKNVKHGEVSFLNPRRPDGASILGMYGQNGSGKSALIDALEIIQQCMTGRRLRKHLAQSINVDADYCSIECELSIHKLDNNTIYRVVYSFKVKRGDDKSCQSLRVFDEKLALANETPGNKSRLTTFIDTSGDGIFRPVSKYKQFIGNGDEKGIKLAVEKKLAYRESRSFVFSVPLLHSIIDTRSTSDKWLQAGDDVIDAIEALNNFSLFQMFVLNIRNAGILALDALPFVFRIVTDKKTWGGGALLRTKGVQTIPEKIYKPVCSAIENMNIVLRELVPGLEVSLLKIGTEIMDNGEKGINVQLVSVRGNCTIPFSCESEGIKRIVSFLHLLILVFNDPSVTVAIDEIDSGVFEYLLGELLGILAEHGQGQLIFTSHNLRPLETIDRGFIAFTTTNPFERYIRIANAKSSNNIRDLYYRGVVLGGQKERLYEPTNTGDIELAFIEAGV